MKCLPASAAPTTCFTRSKKYCLKIFGSSVLPDLLETMKIVFAMSSFAFERFDLSRIGGIKNQELRVTGDVPKGELKNFDAQT